MSILIVVAHPDDEVLGLGASIAKLADEGYEVYSCILSGGAEARRKKPEQKILLDNIYQANKILGVKEVIMGSFPNIEFNTIPHLKLVQFIEQAIEKVKADIIVTHHPGDLNNDHLQTSLACQAATRLFQRKPDIVPLQSLFFMEVLSSTDWSFPAGLEKFCPDTFIEVGQEYMQKKIEALRTYVGIMRDYPHPRSEETLWGLAAYRGSQAGLFYAEGLQTAFRRIGRKDQL